MFDPQIPYDDLPMLSSITLELTPKLIKLCEDARVAIELLNYALQYFSNSESLLDTLALQEARTSSNIENIRTTNDDLLRAVAFNDFDTETQAISDYKDALLTGFELLSLKGQFGIEDLEAINAPVNTQGRGVRSNLSNFNTLTRIKKANGIEDEIIYTPPHGKERLMLQLADMLDYIYDDEQYNEHPLIKIALAHCHFENIHPFNDGNGRTGRILNILFLCQKGYLSQPILYASSYIIKNKNEYYEVLRTSKENNDYIEAAAYILRSFKETADRTRHIKVAQEDLTIELIAEDQAFDGISTDVAMADKTYSLIDEIIEKFNAHYANAGAEMEEMIDTLFKDEDLRMNVKNSAPSAYECAAYEKLSNRIKEHMIDGMMTNNQEKTEYYSELNADTNTQKQICNRIIRKIKDWLNLAS